MKDDRNSSVQLLGIVTICCTLVLISYLFIKQMDDKLELENDKYQSEKLSQQTNEEEQKETDALKDLQEVACKLVAQKEIAVYRENFCKSNGREKNCKVTTEELKTLNNIEKEYHDDCIVDMKSDKKYQNIDFLEYFIKDLKKD